jgi:hypothetical protein
MYFPTSGIANCSLTGAIPWRDLADQPFLISVNLNANKFTGTIPEEVYSMTKLTNLQFATNNISGTLSNDIGKLTKLTALLVSNNELSGTVPTTITMLGALETLYLSGNSFSGTLPALAPLGSLSNLRVFQNQLVGSDFSDFKVPATCILEFNNDTNCFPNCPAPCCMTSLNMSCNVVQATSTPVQQIASTVTVSDTTTSTTTSTTAVVPPVSAPSPGGGLSVGAIVGIACGVTAAALIALIVGLWFGGVFKRPEVEYEEDPNFPTLFVPLSVSQASPVYSNIPEGPLPSTNGYAELPRQSDGGVGPSAPPQTTNISTIDSPRSDSYY